MTQTVRVYPTKPSKVYLYATCLVDMFDPESGLDAISLLEHQGLEVIYVPKQTCCGQPAYSSGYDDDAKAIALSQIALLPPPWPIVVMSGSCGGMMHHHYRRLFQGDEEHQDKVNEFCDRVFELTEFLVHVCGAKFTDKGEPTSVVLHTSCAARREMKVHVTSQHLLSQLNHVDVKLQAYESECCGFGGTFSVKHPNISQAMVEDKSRHLSQTEAKELVSADWGCLLNINGALEYQGKEMKGKHLASFLWQRVNGQSGDDND